MTLLITLSSLTGSCRQPSGTPALQQTTTTANPINPTPHAPHVHDFITADDGVAAELLMKVENNARSSRQRRLLAQHYAKTSPRANEFFDQTSDFADRQTVSGSRPGQPLTHRCPAEVGPETHKAFLDLQHRFAFAGPNDAQAFLNAAVEARQRHGESCDLLIMWAKAVMFAAEWKSGPPPPTEQEKALRILLELGEEYAPFHEGEPSPQLFLDIAGYFALVRHDYVSAYIAATWARQRLNSATEMSSELRQRYSERIDRAEKTYRERALQ